MPRFNPGDIVQLKSGGPAMTIDWCKADQSDLDLARCTWFDRKNTPRAQIFPATSLKLYSDPEEMKPTFKAG